MGRVGSARDIHTLSDLTSVVCWLSASIKKKTGPAFPELEDELEMFWHSKDTNTSGQRFKEEINVAREDMSLQYSGNY